MAAVLESTRIFQRMYFEGFLGRRIIFIPYSCSSQIKKSKIYNNKYENHFNTYNKISI